MHPTLPRRETRLQQNSITTARAGRDGTGNTHPLPAQHCVPQALTMGCGWDDGVFCGFSCAFGPGPGPGPGAGPGPGTGCWLPGIRGGTLVWRCRIF